MHRLLERQLKRYEGGTDSPPRQWADFLQAIDAAYEEADGDKLLLERSLDLASQELTQRNASLRLQAATDGLTGLANHRTFHERIRIHIDRAQEKGHEVGLIMMDVDGFKRVNDSLGHQAGDSILREIAGILTDTIGAEGSYRYGGDEFAALLPEKGPEETMSVAERVRQVTPKRTTGSGTRVTMSLGIACFPATAETVEELVYGADAAMYWAKSAGKNRVGDWSRLVKERADGRLPWYAADRGVRAPDVVAAFVAALAAKDPLTSAHTERCSWYALTLAEEIGLDEEEMSIVRLASLLHDVGKIAVPDQVLSKPGPLDEKEWAQMKQHPTAALNVLGQIRAITEATPAILHHHEHFDGSGYPDGLKGKDIPIASRILLVTDAFDAMTSDRPYRRAMPVEHAIQELARCSGTQFDPEIVQAFLRILPRNGTLPQALSAPPTQAQEQPGAVDEAIRPASRSRAEVESV
jgi:diguanylate cyclase (GGDEF)-like protein